MNKVYLDFETYYSSKDFSLSKMSTQDYITDPRFETIGVAIAVDDADPVWYTGTDIATALHTIDWTTSIMVAHNAQFDGAILHYIYGIQPAYLLCTWSLARVTGAFIIEGGSLAKLAMVAQQAGLTIPHKGIEVILADGKRTKDFTPRELAAYGVYCKTDVAICRALYKELRPQTTAQELEFQDNIIKAFTRPLLTLDVPLLEQERDSERTRKEQLFVEVQELLGIPNIKEVSKALASPLSFAKVLTKLGVEPPTKLSKTTGKRTNSFAKTDAGMLALLEHENPLVALVTAVKLGTNGSISETRAVRMLEVSGRGPLPMSYIIHGAHTSRLSGGGERCLSADHDIICYTIDSLVVCKKLPDVLITDLVWDGLEFVCHDGVVFNGFKEVITYDGITATADHIVFTGAAEPYTPTTILDAMQAGACIVESNKPSGW